MTSSATDHKRIASEDYRAGWIDGKLIALEEMQKKQSERLDNHGQRISKLERVAYIVFGIVIFIQVWPTVKVFLST